MKKCIIFGCGYIGKAAYEKLKTYYEVIAWCDNNKSLQGKMINSIPVIKPSDIITIADKDEIEIFVAMLDTKEIVSQLRELNLHNINVWKGGFFYNAAGLYPLEFPFIEHHKKEGDNCLHVLFISDLAAIRDNKMAYIVKNAGNKIFLAYIVETPYSACPEFADMYEKIYPIMSINQLVDFVENSEFDIIHCSSEPEYVTPILLDSGKIVVHDCHDLRSSNQLLSPDKLMLEYLAHTGASGVIYPSEELREEAILKFGLEEKRTLTIENYPSKGLQSKKKEKKLSESDGKIHCVYEGRITYGDKECRRYFEEIWLKIVAAGVHIHFYSQCDKKYCEYLDSLHDGLHYEGNISSNGLSNELTQYDVGLCIYNNNHNNQLYLEATSPIKLYEYINAGIPVAVGNVATHINIVKNNGFGDQVDLCGDIISQMKNIAQIEIPDNILEEKGYLFDCMTDKLLDFYNTLGAGKENGIE